MSKASTEALEVLPENTTDCPFVTLFSGNKRKHDNVDDNNGSFFWGEDAKRAKITETPRNGYICKRCNVPGHYIKDCPEIAAEVPSEGYVCNICKNPGHFIRNCPERSQQPRQPRGEQPKLDSCWFCLSNPKVEKHLIVSIGSEMYVTLAKGPVVTSKDSQVPGLGHLLMIPITHYPTFGKIPMETQIEVVAELEKYKSAIRRLFDQYGQDIVIFEVSRESFKGLSHAHIQIVPVPKSKSDLVEKIAREKAAADGMDLIDRIPVS